MSLGANWTKDKDGNPVDWTKPPYTDPSRKHAPLQLVLEGEDPLLVPAHTYLKRAREYMAIIRKRSNGTLRKPVDDADRCGWPGCSAAKTTPWACDPHWNRLTADLRREIMHTLPAKEAAGTRPTVAHVRAIRNATAWAINQEKKRK